MVHKLSQDIQHAYHQLLKAITCVPLSNKAIKMFDGTGGKVSVSDLIAYQIGWGKSLIRWYEAGIKGEMPEMPGEGFLKWNYSAIAEHFYEKYRYDSLDEQMEIFEQVVLNILKITEAEYQIGSLDQVGIWSWCALSSGKKWPLSKWIRINTVSPYKRAAQSIIKFIKNKK